MKIKYGILEKVKQIGNSVRITIDGKKDIEFIHIWKNGERLGHVTIYTPRDGKTEVTFKKD